MVWRNRRRGTRLLKPSSSLRSLGSFTKKSSDTRGRHGSEVSACAICFAKDIAVTGCSVGEIKVWSLTSGHDLHMLLGHEHAITCLAMSASAELLVSGDEHGMVMVGWCIAFG